MRDHKIGFVKFVQLK